MFMFLAVLFHHAAAAQCQLLGIAVFRGPQNFWPSVEFAHFCREFLRFHEILQNSIIAGDYLMFQLKSKFAKLLDKAASFAEIDYFSNQQNYTAAHKYSHYRWGIVYLINMML